MSGISYVKPTFIDEHRSSSLIVKSSGDTRGIRDRTCDHFSTSLSIDLLEFRNITSVGGNDHRKHNFRVASTI